MKLDSLITDLKLAGLSHDAGVLAGGRSSRMGGQDKGLMFLDKSALVSSAIRLLQPLAKDQQVLLNCNRDQEKYLALSSRICEDSYPEYPGPLAGLHALLKASNCDILFVTPCDTPFVNAELINLLGQRALAQHQKGQPLRPVALQCENFKHPLHCCLPKSSLCSISKHIEQGKHKLVRWFVENDAEWVDAPDPRSLVNINTPEELQLAENRLLNT